VVGIIALSLFGYGFFSDPSNNIPVPSGAKSAVEEAKNDLAKRKGIDKKKITLVSVESVDWPDTSLGYPEPGMMYAQVITPGCKIFLSHEEEIFEYHSDKGDRVIYCGSVL